MVCAGVPTDVARSISVHKSASIFSPYNIVAEDQKRDALERTQGYLRESVEQQRERVQRAATSQNPVNPLGEHVHFHGQSAKRAESEGS